MKRPEILAPVGDFAMLNAAINAGCNSVYFGTKILNMRANAKNFEINQLPEVVKICHTHNVRAYLTVNTIIYENELGILDKLLNEAKKAGVDAIIAWDLAVIQKAKELGLEIHLSTQASVSNSEALKCYHKKFGVTRIVLARECTLEQIKEIKNKTKLEIECFIHGAMCISVSGRCFMSQFLFNCSANRGECLQPCRRQYKIVDVEEPEKELLIGPNYVLSPKDLCTLPIIDKLIGTVDVLKIEGRNKSPEYVKTIVECYKEAIDLFFEGKLDDSAKQKLIEKAKTVYNRDLSTGFYAGKPMNEWAQVEGSRATKNKKYIGQITKVYEKANSVDVKIETGNLKINDDILIIGNKVGVHEQKITSLQIKEGLSVSQVNKGDLAGLLIKGNINKIMPKDKVFVFA
ncbi:U32 family peptidase [Candidatus Woesearchaeota archaeon]|nr:U32 family peptidase [Candidatus Woesearchaeota archaeon]